MNTQIFVKLENECEIKDEEEDLLKPALVRPEPEPNDDLSVPPMNGEQYLRRVMEEAKRCEAVVVAKAKQKPQKQFNQMPNLPNKKECKSELLPNKSWQLSTTADFSKLRLKIETVRKSAETDPEVQNFKSLLPSKDDEYEWQMVILNQAPDFIMTPGPTTKLCLAVSQVNLWSLLEYLNEWMKNGQVTIQDGCQWVYCLLACLELPVSSDIYFKLRQIARTLSDYRANIVNPESEELPHINLLMCIIGRYFNQLDLADPFC